MPYLWQSEGKWFFLVHFVIQIMITKDSKLTQQQLSCFFFSFSRSCTFFCHRKSPNINLLHSFHAHYTFLFDAHYTFLVMVNEHIHTMCRLFSSASTIFSKIWPIDVTHATMFQQTINIFIYL